jgi:hypothetical protein
MIFNSRITSPGTSESVLRSKVGEIGSRRSSSFDRDVLNQTTSLVSLLTNWLPVSPGMMIIGARPRGVGTVFGIAVLGASCARPANAHESSMYNKIIGLRIFTGF